MSLKRKSSTQSPRKRRRTTIYLDADVLHIIALLVTFDITTMHAAILVNSMWCSIFIRELWKRPFSLVPSDTRGALLIDILAKCLPREIQQQLNIYHPPHQQPRFRYPTLVRELDFGRFCSYTKYWNKAIYPAVCVGLLKQFNELSHFSFPDIVGHCSLARSLIKENTLFLDNIQYLEFHTRTPIAKQVYDFLCTHSRSIKTLAIYGTSTKTRSLQLQRLIESQNDLCNITITTFQLDQKISLSHAQRLTHLELNSVVICSGSLDGFVECQNLKALILISCLFESTDALKPFVVLSKLRSFEFMESLYNDKANFYTTPNINQFIYSRGNTLSQLRVSVNMKSDLHLFMTTIATRCLGLLELTLEVDDPTLVADLPVNLLCGSSTLEKLVICHDKIAILDEGYWSLPAADAILRHILPCTNLRHLKLIEWSFEKKNTLTTFLDQFNGRLEYVSWYVKIEEASISKYAQRCLRAIRKCMLRKGGGNVTIDCNEHSHYDDLEHVVMYEIVAKLKWPCAQIRVQGGEEKCYKRRRLT